MKKDINKSDLEYLSFLSLRHTSASLLLAKGWRMKDISEWLGHCNINVTMNTYAHIDINRKKGLSKGVGSMFKNKVSITMDFTCRKQPNTFICELC